MTVIAYSEFHLCFPQEISTDAMTCGQFKDLKPGSRDLLIAESRDLCDLSHDILTTFVVYKKIGLFL